jgi:hypothetical protein
VSAPYRPRRFALSAALLLAAVLLAACTLQHREVIAADPKAKQEVAILTGAPQVDPPADPGFAQLTPLQAEASLQRLIVRPATWSTLVHDPATPLLSPDQMRWVRDQIVAQLPRLKADQRLQLRFRDRFHGYNVEVELFGQGTDLVYRFTQLSAMDPYPDATLGERPTRPLAWVALDAQPGQRVDTDAKAYLLYDPLLATNAQGQTVAELAAELESAVKDGKVPEAELADVRALLQGRPTFTVESLRIYLGKLSTLVRARDQGLLNEQEAAQRKAQLLQELAPGAGKPAN